jgi:transcriptional regulator with XRE-family HTH domain
METYDDDQLLSAFSAVLRECRTKADLSQEELAHRAGKSIRYISLLESRRHQPSLATLRRLCLGLGISMEVFVRAIETRISDKAAQN